MLALIAEGRLLDVDVEQVGAVVKNRFDKVGSDEP